MNVQSPGQSMGAIKSVVEGGIVGGNFSDPTNERIIYLSALGLVLVAGGLLVGTIVWWRRGREEHPALAPLEVMGGRSWVKAPEAERRRRLDEVRVVGAGGTADVVAKADPVDLDELMRSEPQAFDDLREPGAVVEPPEVVTPAGDAAEPVDVAAVDGDVEVLETPEAAEVAAVAEPVEAETAVKNTEAAAAVTTATKPRSRSPRKPKTDEVVRPAGAQVAEAGAPAAAEVAKVADVSEVSDADATTFATERPSTDVAPVPNGKTSAASNRSTKPRKSPSATANSGSAASKSPSSDPLL